MTGAQPHTARARTGIETRTRAIARFHVHRYPQRRDPRPNGRAADVRPKDVADEEAGDHDGGRVVSAPAWESRLRRAAKRQGLVIQKRGPCGACWALKHADGNRLHRSGCLSPTQVAGRLGVDLSDWIFPEDRCDPEWIDQ